MPSPPTPEELAARRAAEQAAEEQAVAQAAQAAANAAAQQAAQEAAQRLAAQEAANRMAAERLAKEAARLRLKRSLHEQMDVDTSLVFPLPQGSVAQVYCCQSWKTLTGYFDRNPKTSMEVSTLLRNFEQCITSGNWTQHMAINNFTQILTGTASTWMELLQPYEPKKMKKWDIFKEAFLAEFQAIKNESEAHEQVTKLVQGKTEKTRDFSYRVKQTVAVIRKYKAELPAGATEIQCTVAMMQKQRVEEEINQYFMNGLRPEVKAAITRRSTYHCMNIDEKIQLAIQVEFSMTPTTLPMDEMGQQATKETEKEGEEKKGLEELT